MYISFPTLPLTSFRKKSVKIVHGQDNLVQLCVFCYYLHIQCAFDLKNLLILTKKFLCVNLVPVSSWRSCLVNEVIKYWEKVLFIFILLFTDCTDDQKANIVSDNGLAPGGARPSSGKILNRYDRQIIVFLKDDFSQVYHIIQEERHKVWNIFDCIEKYFAHKEDVVNIRIEITKIFILKQAINSLSSDDVLGNHYYWSW